VIRRIHWATFRSSLDHTQSDAFADSHRGRVHHARLRALGYRITRRAEFIGYVGLALQNFDAHFTLAADVGWRLARDYWGAGSLARLRAQRWPMASIAFT